MCLKNGRKMKEREERRGKNYTAKGNDFFSLARLFCALRLADKRNKTHSEKLLVECPAIDLF